jgi:hypothetical protein
MISAYARGAYAPLLQRIYLAPRTQANPNLSLTYWHYIDCKRNELIPYEHHIDFSNLSNLAYQVAVFSFQNGNIYFIPYRMAIEPYWDYIDGKTVEVKDYQHQLNSDFQCGSYVSGVYAPINEEIYFAPFHQTGEIWHALQFFDNSKTGKDLASQATFNKF